MPPRSAFRRLAAPIASAQSSLLPSPDESFWQALVDAEVFTAPMGSAVDVVAEGTVVKEVARFVDPFNERWLATVGEDGHHVWLRELEELSLSEDEAERDEEWVPAVVEGQADGGVPPVSSKQIRTRLPELAPICESSLFEFFWSSVFDAAAHRDWNSEYQRACEFVLFGTPDGEVSVDDARSLLQRVIEEFSSDVETGVTSIVSEMFESSTRSKEVAKHPSVSGVYYFNGIMFQIAIDGSGQLGGDEGAMKVSSHIFKNIQTLSHIAPRYFFALPMALSMTFGGYRVLATSIPPIGACSSAIVTPEGSFVAGLLTEFSTKLNLKPFMLDGNITLSPSFRIVAGHDCRMYLLGVSDVMPPIAPPSMRTTYNPQITSRFWRLRSEAIEQSQEPLSAFAYFGKHSNDDDEAGVLKTTHWVRCVGLQTCAAVLGLMERCSIDGLEEIECSGCGKTVQDELRFGVCAAGCCHICAQCNINAYECIVVKGDAKGCSALLKSYVKCGARSLNIRSLRLTPDVGTILHHHGVNLRLLHAVYSLLPRSARGIMGHYLEVEMVARAAKCVLHRKLRRQTTSLPEIGAISAKFFMNLMQPSGEAAEAFWSQELGPAIQELFDVFVPFDTEALDIVRVCTRVSELTGVVLTDESIESFALLQTRESDGSQQKSSGASGETNRAFIQISSINPTMKDFRIPTFCGEVGERRAFLNDRLAPLLLLWAGEMDRCREQFMLFEDSHPEYLTEKTKTSD